VLLFVGLCDIIPLRIIMIIYLGVRKEELTMKKKLLAGVIALGVVLVPVLSYFYFSKDAGVSEDVTRRSLADIQSDEVTMMDDPIVALSDVSSDNVALRNEVIKAYQLVNDERAEAGLDPLEGEAALENVAAVRAQEASVSFSHTRPNGKQWNSVNSAIMGGENLAYGFDDASSAVNAWMNSPLHKENILWPEFTTMGISIYETDDGTCYWSQEFGY